jgi:hypothetical protein
MKQDFDAKAGAGTYGPLVLYSTLRHIRVDSQGRLLQEYASLEGAQLCALAFSGCNVKSAQHSCENGSMAAL